MNKGVLIAIMVLVFAGGAAFVLRGSPAPTPSSTNNSSSVNQLLPEDNTGVDEIIVDGESEDSPAREINVSGTEFKFSQSSLSINAGETVNITFKNEGKMSHNFVVDGLNAKTKILSPGQQETITVRADKAGTYIFYCSVGNHRAQGMVGTLEVE